MLLKGSSQLGQPISELIAVLRGGFQLNQQLPGQLVVIQCVGY